MIFSILHSKSRFSLATSFSFFLLYSSSLFLQLWWESNPLFRFTYLLPWQGSATAVMRHSYFNSCGPGGFRTLVFEQRQCKFLTERTYKTVFYLRKQKESNPHPCTLQGYSKIRLSSKSDWFSVMCLLPWRCERDSNPQSLPWQGNKYSHVFCRTILFSIFQFFPFGRLSDVSQKSINKKSSVPVWNRAFNYLFRYYIIKL